MLSLILLLQQTPELPILPVRTEVVAPKRNPTFNKGGTAKKRVQGGNPRTVGGILMFDGAMDGNRQVDPQIAVGGGYVLHGTNSGLLIYDKKGNYVDGVPQKEFADGIDPKLFFDVNNRFFGFDLWVYWDAEKIKPVNLSFSETDNPTKAWNTYSVSASKGVDGGGIGYSRKWVGYSFPGGDERTFIMKSADVKAGKPATVYHFAGSLGSPVLNQDRNDDLFFVELTREDIIIRRVSEGKDGVPVVSSVVRKPHDFKYFGSPPQATLQGTTVRLSSGDRNPKNLIIQGNSLWFSQAVNVDGRAGVQWNQFKLDGTKVQSGVISHPSHYYMQTTVAVNKRNDLLLGFQESGPDMFVSARASYRFGNDPLGTTRSLLNFMEGIAAPPDGGAWGDYSSSCVDGDNMLDLWTVQTYGNEKGRGSTVIAKVVMDSKMRDRK
ncbi:MAG: hypothetical protein LW628_00380 [Fimbriimonadaceae bacterium]|jgi:hypothetical protein|nr:hypothetical protein [Fimbriimonadaceae bacterium]